MSNRSLLKPGRPSAKTCQTTTLAGLSNQKETVRVNFDLDHTLHTKLKIYAIMKGKSIKEVLTDFVEQLPD